MSKESIETDYPLFLISPPGSTEARDIGYINIPKIVKEPPPELSEVQEFIDEAVTDEMVADETGFRYSTQESNAWVLKSAIEKKKASFDEIIPLFPQLLKYSIPWILCEYAYHCIKENDDLGFKDFVFNTIQYRCPDYFKIAELVYGDKSEKKWSKKKKPIAYLKGILKKRNEWGESESFIDEESMKREWEDKTGLFHIKHQNKITGNRYLSFDEPIITDDTTEALMLEQSIADPKGLYRIPARLNHTYTSNNVIEDLLIGDLGSSRETSLFRDVKGACQAANLSEKATQALLYHLENAVSVRGATYELGFSPKDYEAIKKMFQRKRSELQNYLSKTTFPNLKPK